MSDASQDGTPHCEATEECEAAEETVSQPGELAEDAARDEEEAFAKATPQPVGEPAEILSGEMRIYDPNGVLLCGITGYAVKKATRTALLSAFEGVEDLLYEVVWREHALESGLQPADFFPAPSAVAAGSGLFSDYLSAAGVDPESRNALLADLECWSRSYALLTLEKLGWRRRRGEAVDSERLRQQLGVVPEHRRLFLRMLEMLAKSDILEKSRPGILDEGDVDSFVVVSGSDDPLPGKLPSDPEGFATRMAELYPHGLTEVGLFRRSGGALADVLLGRADPLTLLFSSGEPTAADLYLKAPVARAANSMLRDAVRKLLAQLPEGRRLRVIEVGAGTGSATASLLPELPEGRFDYTYTDISAGFFAEAESRFGDSGRGIEYLPLDIEECPVEQGFTPHGYDLVIASNVLHATRHLEETLGHCLSLLAPSGQLVALENLRGLGWMDLTFGQLDGWWRFADAYRPHHALAIPEVWRRALADAGFEEAEVLGVDDSFSFEMLDKGVIVAQGPTQVTEPPGVWVLTGGHCDTAGEIAAGLAAELQTRNQTVVLASRRAQEAQRTPNQSERNSGKRSTEQRQAVDRKTGSASGSGSLLERSTEQRQAVDRKTASQEASADSQPSTNSHSIIERALDTECRESWRQLIKQLPGDVPLSGVVHLHALAGHGVQATAAEMAGDVRHAGASALALVQGLAESDAVPVKGMWFLTSGAQVLERERLGELSGSVLWGLGKVMALEAPQLQPRMIDLDPGTTDPLSDLADELLYPDGEDHIAYRSGRRLTARLVRPDAVTGRLELPEESSWVLEPDTDGVFDRPQIKLLPTRSLQSREVRVAVEAAGLNFWDVFRSLGFIEEGDLGREMCGHVVDVGSDVSTAEIGDHVVGLGFGAFAHEMVTHEELVAQAPDGVSPSALAAIPSAFVSAALSFRFSRLEAGERVLIHAAAGGVGTAAIQLAQAAGAEVFATASVPKHGFVRSLGVEHVFDSRQTRFGDQILKATGGEGVHVVLNSLTSEGFIDASLSCLTTGGRFVELARRDILSEEEMAALRPDAPYHILELDVLKKTDPALVGEVLRGVMDQLAEGGLRPPIHSRWPLAEAGPALGFMRSARHLGKIVVTTNPLSRGSLRQDRTYLVTGGLGGIGCAVADWLAQHGAGVIVLNGRRAPSAEAEEAIETLRKSGSRIEVELADMADPVEIDAMLARMDAELPPLGGVIHSVGVLSDAALTNQTWASFKQVLWPKIVGAWHLHRATADRDLDLFILFSSRVGVMGNPGQANHAATNAFLDQLAGHRRAQGLPGQAIAWGAWSEIGEAAEQKDRIERRRAALGGRWFTPQQGLKALERLVSEDATNSVVMSMDWPVFQEAVNIEDQPPLLEDLLSSISDDGADDTDSSSSDEDLLTRLRSAPFAEHEALLVSFLQQEVQAVLRLPEAPSPTVGFFDLGMDSLMTVELRNRMNRAFAGEHVTPNTVVFDYPDIDRLARHLAEELGQLREESESSPTPEPLGTRLLGAVPSGTQPTAERTPETASPGAEPVEPPVQTRSPLPRQPTKSDGDGDGDGIAVVGMACRFPDASDLTAFWELLETGTDAITDGRRGGVGSWKGVVGDPDAKDVAYRRGAFVDGIDGFDSGFFRILPIEARAMDPQQRMLLETTWQALEDAGLDPDRLQGSRTGVYAGIGSSEYRDLIRACNRTDSYIGTTGSVAVGRIAFTLGLEGPAIPIDMACASSLASVHQAVAGLQRGEVDLALAGGVNAVLSPFVSRFMMDVGMLSPTGRCNPFDASADGYVRGEGCGMVVLKRLSEAEADGDRIWAVIRGSAISQNGASAGLTVPNGSAQERVMRETLAQTGAPPSQVDYLEAHATGSQLSDQIELHAAAAVYGEGRDGERPLLVGSVKSNIGHTEWAAGIAALIKTVLSMNKGVIPRLIHFRTPNSQVEWERIPVRIASDSTAWPTDSSRPPLAGVNAFGLAGANACVLIEGYRSLSNSLSAGNSAGLSPGGPRPVPVSLPETPEGSPTFPTSSAPQAAGKASPPGEVSKGGSIGEGQAARLLPLSGKSVHALRELAERYLSWLDGWDAGGQGRPASAATLADMAWTASMGRSHFTCRAAVVFNDVESLRQGLKAVSDPDRQQATEQQATEQQATEQQATEQQATEQHTLDDRDARVKAAAADYQAGLDVSFSELFQGETRRRISLPSYPFQRKRYWVEPL